MTTIYLDLTPQQERNANVADKIMRAVCKWYTAWGESATSDELTEHVPQIDQLSGVLEFFRDNFEGSPEDLFKDLEDE